MHNRRVTIESARAPSQPFDDTDTGLVVMLDGEIFNYAEVRERLSNYYRFSTEGVCEVVAKAYDRWGDNCFDRFEGYFAIVIYNRFFRGVAALSRPLWNQAVVLCHPSG